MPTMTPVRIHILFDGPPGPTAGRFIEAEDDTGRSINAGEWVDRGNGQWALVIDRATVVADSPELAQARERIAALEAEVAFRNNLALALGMLPSTRITSPEVVRAAAALRDEPVWARIVAMANEEWTTAVIRRSDYPRTEG